jgi:hypothetical protein
VHPLSLTSALGSQKKAAATYTKRINLTSQRMSYDFVCWLDIQMKGEKNNQLVIKMLHRQESMKLQRTNRLLIYKEQLAINKCSKHRFAHRQWYYQKMDMSNCQYEIWIFYLQFEVSIFNQWNFWIDNIFIQVCYLNANTSRNSESTYEIERNKIY